MCEPTTATLMYASMAATAASTVMQYQASRDQASYQEDIGKYNQRVKENQAVDVRNQGLEAENQARQQARQLQSKQRATLASRGVFTDSGSALALQEDTERFGNVDALRIRNNAERQAQALETGGELTASQAQADAMASRNRGTSALLSGSGKVASSWYTLKNT